MSPFKRSQRAKDKQRARGAHAKPAPEKLRGGEPPVGREPFVQLLGTPGAFGASVPVELAEQDYEFPHVDVPRSRPIVSAGELLEALEGDDEPEADERPTEPIPVIGTVLDGEPQPARHAGLAPAAAPVIPVPDNPFLNAHPPRGRHAGRPEPEPQVASPLGPDQSAALSGPELAILGRPVPANLPAPVRAPRPRGRVFGEFDGAFWSLLIATQRRAHAVADTLARDNDRTANALDRALEAAQQCVDDGLAQINAPTSTLPRRTPGAAKAAVDAEAELAELAVAQ